MEKNKNIKEETLKEVSGGEIANSKKLIFHNYKCKSCGIIVKSSVPRTPTVPCYNCGGNEWKYMGYTEE